MSKKKKMAKNLPEIMQHIGLGDEVFIRDYQEGKLHTRKTEIVNRRARMTLTFFEVSKKAFPKP